MDLISQHEKKKIKIQNGKKKLDQEKNAIVNHPKFQHFIIDLRLASSIQIVIECYKNCEIKNYSTLYTFSIEFFLVLSGDEIM